MADRKPVEGEEVFLRRWSRRKRAAASAEAAQPESEATVPQPPDTPSMELSAEEPLPELPSIDSLDEHSDYEAFMDPRVSEELRRLALRKLFRLPQFNVRDGLNDYDEDYRDFEALGDRITHEMRRMWERERARAQEQLETPCDGDAAGVAEPEHAQSLDAAADPERRETEAPPADARRSD